MQTQVMTVKKSTVRIAIVERGEHPRQVREDAGFNAAFGGEPILSFRRSEDWMDEADYAASYPNTYAAMKAAGMDLTNAVAILEQIQ